MEKKKLRHSIGATVVSILEVLAKACVSAIPVLYFAGRVNKKDFG